MRELVILASSPATQRFAWENYIYLNNLRERGLSSKAQILVFIPFDMLEKGPHPLWKQLEKDFPEAGVFYYEDKKEFQISILRLQKLFNYDPLCRVYCLSKHWGVFPELKDKAILYTDSDILVLDHMDFTPFLDDDVCYMSEANSYTNSTYFDSKSEIETNPDSPIYQQPKWVKPERWETFKKRDILNECAKACGITRAGVETIVNNSGAAQYLLKNIDQHYWNQVFDACIELRNHLAGVNQEFMRGDTGTEKENNGFQSFCADIWAVTWNLIRRGITIKTPVEFDFAWSTDEIHRLSTAGFYHNAGITSDAKLRLRRGAGEIEAPAFYKGADYFVSQESITPFNEEFQPILDEIINDPINQMYCNNYYAREIKKVKALYALN